MNTEEERLQFFRDEMARKFTPPPTADSPHFGFYLFAAGILARQYGLLPNDGFGDLDYGTPTVRQDLPTLKKMLADEIAKAKADMSGTLSAPSVQP